MRRARWLGRGMRRSRPRKARTYRFQIGRAPAEQRHKLRVLVAVKIQPYVGLAIKSRSRRCDVCILTVLGGKALC